MSVVMSLKFPIEVNWIYKLELYLYFQNSACTGLQFDIPVAACVSFFKVLFEYMAQVAQLVGLC